MWLTSKVISVRVRAALQGKNLKWVKLQAASQLDHESQWVTESTKPAVCLAESHCTDSHVAAHRPTPHNLHYRNSPRIVRGLLKKPCVPQKESFVYYCQI